MACNNSGVFYWSGASFMTATMLYTDSNLSNPAPDGWYSIGGNYRQISGGVLGSVTTCPACLVPCETSLNAAGQGSGKYVATFDIGPTLGVVIIRFNSFNVPDMCTWSYDYDNSGTPTVASEYSSNTWGYLTGIVGLGIAGSATCTASDGTSITFDNALGSSGVSVQGTVHDYNNSGPPDFNDTGVATTLGPYTGSQVSLVTGSSGYVSMVVPKPNNFPTTMDIIIDAPCNGTVFVVRASCPTDLNRFTCKPSPQPCGAAPLLDPFFTSHPSHNTGFSTTVNVGDWVFDDQYGVTPKAAGTYLVDNNGSPDCIVVSANGVVTSITTCSGSC